MYPYATLAALLLALYYLYTLLRVKLRVAERGEVERLGFSLGALILLGFVLVLDAAEFAAGVGGNPVWTDPELTREIGRRLVEAAEGVLSWIRDWLRGVALASGAAMVAFWVAVAVAGPLAILAAWAVSIGLEALLGVLRAVVMVAQAVWATGKFYMFVASIAPLFRVLAPLGVALMTAPRLRRAGAGLFALSVLLGYALPYALNAAAAAASTPRVELPEQLNATLEVPATISLTQSVTLPNGTVVVLYAPPGAFALIESNGTLLARPLGVVTALPLNGSVVKVGFTNAFIPEWYLPQSSFAVSGLASLNCSGAGPLELEKCRWREVPELNLSAAGLFIAGGPGGWGWAYPVEGKFAVDLKLARSYVNWYDKPFPDISSKILAILSHNWSRVEKVPCTVTINDSQVNATCTAATAIIKGSLLGDPVVKPGKGSLVVNGTAYTLPAEVDVQFERAEQWEWSLCDAALAFNRTALLLNATLPNGTVHITFQRVSIVCSEVNGVPRRWLNGTLAMYVTIIDTSKPPAPGYRGPAGKTFASPAAPGSSWWHKPLWSTRAKVTAVYPGEIAEPVVVTFSLAEYGIPADSTVLLLSADTFLERVVASREKLNELARSWLNLYPFLTLVAAYFFAAVFACDALSGLLGGPSIVMRFAPSRWRGVYWGLAVSAVASAAFSLLSGRGLGVPSGALLGKYEYALAAKRSDLRYYLERFPLRRLERAISERASLALRPYAERMRFRLLEVRSILADALEKAVDRAEREGFKQREVVLRYVQRIVESRTLPTLLAYTYAFARELARESRNPHLASAVLESAAAALRREAYRRYGSLAPIFAPDALRAARVLEAARVLTSRHLLLQHAVARLALEVVMRPVVLREGASVAYTALALAKLAAAASGDSALARKVQELEKAWLERRLSPPEVVSRAAEVWRGNKQSVERYLGDIKQLVDHLLEEARSTARGEERWRELLNASRELYGMLGSVSIEKLPPGLREATSDAVSSLRRLIYELAVAEALPSLRKSVEERILTVSQMPPLLPRLEREQLVAWQGWLTSAGVPRDIAEKLGERLNTSPGTLLDSALELLKEAKKLGMQDKAVKAIELAYKAVGDPSLRGVLDAVTGRLDADRLLDELRLGGRGYLLGAAAYDPEIVARALAPVVVREKGVSFEQAFQGALAAVRELLGEPIAVTPETAPAYNFARSLLEPLAPLARELVEAGVPVRVARLLATEDPAWSAVSVLERAAREGWEAARQVAEAVQLAARVVPELRRPLVEGAVAAAAGRRLEPSELMDRLQKRDEFLIGYAIVNPELLARSIAPELSRALGIRDENWAALGALAAIREVLLGERVKGPLPEGAEIARRAFSATLVELVTGAKLSEELAVLVRELNIARRELFEAIARGDADAASDAIARGLYAAEKLEEAKPTLRELLSSDAYERLDRSLEAWRQLAGATLEFAERFGEFWAQVEKEYVARPVELEVPRIAEHAAREGNAAREGKLPSLEEFLAGLKAEPGRLDLFDALKLAPEEAERLLKAGIEDPLVRGAVKAKLGLEAEGIERLGYLYALSDKLPGGVGSRVREIIEGFAAGEPLPAAKDAASQLSDVYVRAVRGDDDALAELLVLQAILGIDPGEVLRDVLGKREEASREEARLQAEEVAKTKRLARQVESWESRLESADEALEQLVHELPGSAGFAVTGGSAARIISSARERAAAEAVERVLEGLRRVESVYRDLLATAPSSEAREAVMQRLKLVGELIGELESSLG